MAERAAQGSPPWEAHLVSTPGLNQSSPQHPLQYGVSRAFSGSCQAPSPALPLLLVLSAALQCLEHSGPKAPTGMRSLSLLSGAVPSRALCSPHIHSFSTCCMPGSVLGLVGAQTGSDLAVRVSEQRGCSPGRQTVPVGIK